MKKLLLLIAISIIPQVAIPLHSNHSIATKTVITTKQYNAGELSNVAAMVKQFEAYSDTVYYCQGNKPTIGFGHVLKGYTGQYLQWSEKKALNTLKNDLKYFERAVLRLIGDDLPKFDKKHVESLISLCFNIGEYRLEQSKLLEWAKENPYDYDRLEIAFKSFRKAGGEISNGLIKRRAIEWQHYIKAGEQCKKEYYICYE